MNKRQISIAAMCILVSSSLIAIPAAARTRDVLLGIGAGIGVGIIVNEMAKRAQQGQQPQNGSPGRPQVPRETSRPSRQQGPSAAELAAREEARRAQNERRAAEAQREAEQREEAQRLAAAETVRIKDIQTRLNRLNFDAGEPDGRPGQKTRSAAMAFQSSLGVTATGTLDDDQYAMLKALSDQPATPRTQQAELPPLDSASPQEPSRAPVDVGTSAMRSTGGADSAALPDMAILDVHPLDRAGDVKRKLADAGLTTCRETRSSIVCSSHTDAMSDMVVVGLSSGSEQRAYVVARQMRFKDARQRSDIVERLRASYPKLMPEGTAVVSSESCRSYGESFAHDGFEAVRASILAGAGAAQAAPLAAVCDYHYSLYVSPGDTVEEVSISLFAGLPLRDQQNDGVASSGNSSTSDIRF